MKGTEKIIAHIEAEARSEAEVILAGAKAEAEDIRKKGAEAARAKYEELLNAGKSVCDADCSRVKSMAEMEARKEILALKQELLADVFAGARKVLAAMPREEYVEFLADLASKASGTGVEELVFNETDKAGCAKAVVKAANAKLSAEGKTGKLTVAEETRDIEGGFVLCQGNIETNCSLETLVDMQRGTLAAEVAAVLFE